MKHLDLFSGIGGFALACRMVGGIETVGFCEKEEHLATWLESEWPGVPVSRDVRTLQGADFPGCWLLTAGVPCQPASLAGKRRGAADDRWLWPEGLRVLGEAQPCWALFENPPGIWGVGLPGILAAMEGLGYEVGTIEIPAMAVGAAQDRTRVWIVGHRRSAGGAVGILSERGLGIDRGAQGWPGHDDESGSGGAVADSAGEPERSAVAEGDAEPAGGETRVVPEHLCSRDVWVPCLDPRHGIVARRVKPGLCGLAHGIPAGVRRQALAAFGNSIVPACAAAVIRAMVKEREA